MDICFTILKKTFEHIYKLYSPILYGLALKLSSSEKEAERILIQAFQIYFNSSFIAKQQASVIVILLKLIMQLANGKLTLQEVSEKIKNGELETISLMHDLCFGQEILESHCLQNRQRRMEVAKAIRRNLSRY